jgi:hypothetical protein
MPIREDREKSKPLTWLPSSISARRRSSLMFSCVSSSICALRLMTWWFSLARPASD